MPTVIIILFTIKIVYLILYMGQKSKPTCMYMYMMQLIFFISVNFCFSFVLNSLAYITMPKNNGKMKITEKINYNQFLLQHI